MKTYVEETPETITRHTVKTSDEGIDTSFVQMAGVSGPDATNVFEIDDITVFLAGSVTGEDWRADVQSKLIARHDDGKALHFWNPYTGSALRPDRSNKILQWEQDRMDAANWIFFHVDKSTSPILFVELGQFLSTGKLVLVCDEDVADRDGLVIIASNNGQSVYGSIEDGVNELIRRIDSVGKN